MLGLLGSWALAPCQSEQWHSAAERGADGSDPLTQRTGKTAGGENEHGNEGDKKKGRKDEVEE